MKIQAIFFKLIFLLKFLLNVRYFKYSLQIPLFYLNLILKKKRGIFDVSWSWDLIGIKVTFFSFFCTSYLKRLLIFLLPDSFHITMTTKNWNVRKLKIANFKTVVWNERLDRIHIKLTNMLTDYEASDR
jgi:hypothetical protein